ncbi:hypothetical protein PHYBOEH_006644 [Phytophthora boehmeriae]|uniref:Uncharacterized protein n=1 Tax=Phytophthora boehmeriae TaxID=109152 RepID=A0A8T1WBZ0_9STRA|nr:hypothetical protein PHYBOEH_006644 [Phytophthora boehmeriae]
MVHVTQQQLAQQGHEVEMAVRGLVDQPLKGLGELYENSLKAMLVCGLEFYLSASLVGSFFQCPDESMQAEQELQTLYSLGWMPLALATMLVYGPKLSKTIFPSPENFERNMLHGKIVVWIYSFCFLIWDPDMVIKTGPSLGVSALFCVADVGRFIMDMHKLTEVEIDENGNSFVGDRPPQLQTDGHNGHQPEQQPPVQSQQQSQQQQHRQHHSQQQQQPIQQQQLQKYEENYTVHVIGASAQEASAQKSWRSARQQSPVRSQPPQELQQEQRPSGPPAPLFGSTNKPGSRRKLGLSRKGKRDQELALNQSPSTINSEYVAVLDPNSAAEKEATELVAKKSFTYEF